MGTVWTSAPPTVAFRADQTAGFGQHGSLGRHRHGGGGAGMPWDRLPWDPTAARQAREYEGRIVKE